jgi:uncharacterized protein YpuA (DUF1002 family)
MNFKSAEAYCKTYNADLIEVNNNETHQILYNYYTSKASGSQLWVNISIFSRF